MAQNARLTAYGEQAVYGEPSVYEEQAVESLDEPSGGPEFMAYGSAPLVAKGDYFLPEEMPLFLSSDAAEPLQRRFGSGGERNPDRAVVSSRVFKAAISVAAAAAIAFAILSVQNPLALFANAKASLIGGLSAATPKSAPEPLVAARPDTARPPPAAPAAPALASVAAMPQAAPTRDEIALALRAAHQSQPEIRQAAPAVAVATPPARQLDADELAALLKRARGLIEIGDIGPARLLLERAADAQEASAAFLLAETWDPAVLGTPDERSITPDPAKAREWYRKAAQFGSQDAKLRLSQMQN